MHACREWRITSDQRNTDERAAQLVLQDADWKIDRAARPTGERAMHRPVAAAAQPPPPREKSAPDESPMTNARLSIHSVHERGPCAGRAGRVQQRSATIDSSRTTDVFPPASSSSVHLQLQQLQQRATTPTNMHSQPRWSSTIPRYQRIHSRNAAITTAIRHDPTTTYRTRLLPIRRKRKMNTSIFRRSRIVAVESQLWYRLNSVREDTMMKKLDNSQVYRHFDALHFESENDRTRSRKPPLCHTHTPQNLNGTIMSR